MPRSDLPAAIEAAERYVEVADGGVRHAAARLREGWTRRRRPVATVAKVALPLVGLIWLLRRKKPARVDGNGLYYMGPMQPPKSSLLMGALAAAVASRAIWTPVVIAALAEWQRKKARGGNGDWPKAAPPEYPGTAGTAAAAGDTHVDRVYR